MDKRAHGVIEAPPGRKLIQADFSQAEFRILAHFSQEPRLLRDFQKGRDLHTATAALVFGKKRSKVTPSERAVGKTVNFGILYGQTEHGLSRALGVSLQRARQYIDGFFHSRPQVRNWRRQVHQQARRDEFVSTLSGRRRDLPQISQRQHRKAAERQAFNTMIQGSWADLFKIKLIRLYDKLPPTWHPLLAVHDSVLLEVPEEDEQAAIQWVRDLLEKAISGFTVPLKVEVGSGRTWAECAAD